MTKLRREIVRDEAGLRAVRGEWSDLLERVDQPHVFLSPEWMLTWWKHFGTGRPHVVLWRDGSRLVGLLPAYVSGTPVRDGQPPAGRLRLYGTTHVCSDHVDGLFDPAHQALLASACRNFLAGRGDGWNAVDFTDLAEDGALRECLEPPLVQDRGSMIWGAEVSQICPFINLPDSFDGYLAGLSGKLRREIRGDRRRLAKVGEVTVRHVERPDEMEAAFGIFVRLHQARRQAIGEPGSFADRDYRRFHEEVTPLLAARGWVRLALLYVDGAPVAAQHNYSMGGRLMNYLPGYDPGWHRHSVGLVLLSHCVEDAIERGDRELDMLRGDEPYKSRWCDGSRSLYSLHGSVPLSTVWFRHRGARKIASLKSELRRRLPESVVGFLKRRLGRG